MTPQSSFMILAPILPHRIGAMRALLATMNSGPGIADPANEMIPFGRFDNLMVDAGVAASGGRLIVAEIDPVARWTDLSVFERCVAAAAAPPDA